MLPKIYFWAGRYKDYCETHPLLNEKINEVTNVGLKSLNIDHLFDYIHNAGESTQLIELIDKGIPVMACIYGHASVAFGYNRSVGEFICIQVI